MKGKNPYTPQITNGKTQLLQYIRKSQEFSEEGKAGLKGSPEVGLHLQLYCSGHILQEYQKSLFQQIRNKATWSVWCLYLGPAKNTYKIVWFCILTHCIRICCLQISFKYYAANNNLTILQSVHLDLVGFIEIGGGGVSKNISLACYKHSQNINHNELIAFPLPLPLPTSVKPFLVLYSLMLVWQWLLNNFFLNFFCTFLIVFF